MASPGDLHHHEATDPGQDKRKMCSFGRLVDLGSRKTEYRAKRWRIRPRAARKPDWWLLSGL